MLRLLLLFLLIMFGFNAPKAQELQLNYTYLLNAAAPNLTTPKNGENEAFSLTVVYKVFKQPIFTDLRYQNYHFFDRFGNEFNPNYLSLGVGPRFSLFKYFSYDSGFYIGFLADSETKMVKELELFPARTVHEAQLKSIQRLSFRINFLSNLTFSIHTEMHYHFNYLIQDLNGQEGYQVSYELGYGLSYRF